MIQKKKKKTTGNQWGDGSKWQDRGMRLRATTIMVKIDNNKDTLYSTGNYSHYFVVNFNEIYKNTKSLCCTPETNTTLNQLYFH